MHGGTLGVDPSLDPVDLADLGRRIEILENLFSGVGTILEVGCGRGDFLVRARERGFEVVGLEIDRRALQLCKGALLDVRSSWMEFPDEERSAVTMCVMFHVLEHLDDPRRFLEELVGAFPHLETLVIEVPCADDPLVTLFANREFSEFTYWSHHSHLHTTLSLSLVLQTLKAPVKVDRIQRYGLANHIGWLLEGQPGGHNRFGPAISSEADLNYRRLLVESGYSDTLVCTIQLGSDSKSQGSPKVFCFDIDGTLCTNTEGDYLNAEPFQDRIQRVNQLYDQGWGIILFTARGSTTGIDWLVPTEKQLQGWGVKYHQLRLGKPFADLHIDDKAVNSELFRWGDR